MTDAVSIKAIILNFPMINVLAPSFALCGLKRYNPKYFRIVYRLIDTALIGSYFDDPFTFQSKLWLNVMYNQRWEPKGYVTYSLVSCFVHEMFYSV